jgi:hypothetical protein
LQWEKNLRNAQNLRYEASNVRQKSYDDLMKKLDLPKPEEVIKIEKPIRQTAREIFRADQQSRRDRIAELKTDRDIYVSGAKSPLKKTFGRIGYPVAIGLTNAERYPIYKAKEGVNAVRDLFGKEVDIYTALFGLNAIGRTTTKYLAVGFDMNPEETSSPTAKLLWKKGEPKNEAGTQTDANDIKEEPPVEKKKTDELLPWQHEFNNIIFNMTGTQQERREKLQNYMNSTGVSSKTDDEKARILKDWAQSLPAGLQEKEYGW